VQFTAAGKVTDALKSGVWDVAFLAIEPARAAEIAFTAPYVLIEGTYMVRQDSPLKSIADVDRAGTRIAVGRGSAYDLFLTRTLKNATLVRAESGDAAIAQFIEQTRSRRRREAAAGRHAKAHPDMRAWTAASR
jgi:polar amino acid transport system substrate-binding protein